MKIRNCMIGALVLIMIWPAVAMANAGTPLMWFKGLHLVFGNLVIGLLEGVILALVFKARWGWAISVMIAANYFSAVIGAMVISHVVDGYALNLGNARSFYWTMVGVTYAMTLVLELPFVAVAFYRDPRWLRKTIWGSFAAQTISYAVLFGCFGSISSDSLYTKNQIVDVSQMPLPAQVMVCYIDATDGDVYTMSLTDRRPVKLMSLNSTGRLDRLYVWPTKDRPGRWDLRVVFERQMGQDKSDRKVLRESFAGEVAHDELEYEPDEERDERDSLLSMGRVACLGDARDSKWKFWCGFWPLEGLRGDRKDTGEYAGFGYETLFGEWYVRNATLLPGDVVLFQLGDDQICLFDPHGNQVALLAHGRGPVAVIADDDAKHGEK